MCPHGYHHNGFMGTPALGTQEVRFSLSLYIYRSVFIQVPLRQCSTRWYGAYDTIDDQKVSGYISTLFDRSVS